MKLVFSTVVLSVIATLAFSKPVESELDMHLTTGGTDLPYVIRCDVGPYKKGVTISELTLYTSQRDREFKQLASVSSGKEPKLKNQFAGSGVKVSGKANLKCPQAQAHVATLSVTITRTSPPTSRGPIYKCEAIGKNKNNGQLKLTSTATRIEESLQNALVVIQGYLFDTDFKKSGVHKGRYYAARKTAQEFNIEKANEECVSLGGYLAELDDTDGADFVHDFMTYKNIFQDVYISVIGKKTKKGVIAFKYRSGKPVPEQIWNSDEPSSQKTLHGKEKLCSRLKAGSGKLYIDQCNHRVPYLCEIPVSAQQ